MDSELTSADYVYLVILAAEGREISNTEMAELYKVRLLGADCNKLNDDGYVVTTRKPAPFRHVITDKGVKALNRPLTIDQDQLPKGRKRPPLEKNLFWAGIVAQHKLFAGQRVETPPKPEVEEPVDLDGRIRDAYTRLADGPGKWVDLTALRPLLGDVSKAELDKALTAMLDARDVRLEPEPFGHRIGPEERSAAVHIGGEDRHKLAIGRR